MANVFYWFKNICVIKMKKENRKGKGPKIKKRESMVFDLRGGVTCGLKIAQLKTV